MSTKKERIKHVAAIQLKSGTGTPETKLCIMQAINYIQRDNLGDHPPCVDPVLTTYAIRLNDHILSRVTGTEAEKWSDKIKTLVPVLIDTAGTSALSKKRALFLVHHSITVILPLLTDALELPEISHKLRAFKLSEWKEKEAYCRSIKETLREAGRKHTAAAAAAAAYANAAAAAAYAAYAAAAAAYAADAYADAADAAADAAKWKGIKEAIWEARLDGLKKAAKL